MDSYQGSSGKRQRETDLSERNGRSKRRNQFPGDREQQAMPTPDDTTYRILCPGAKIGSVIGKSGSIIKSLRQETHARIKITDPVPGVDERVILIWSAPKEGARDNVGQESKNRNRDRDGGTRGNDGIKKERNGATEKKEFLCPAQEALFKVHARIAEDGGNLSDEEGGDASPQVIARLLVPNNQIGCLLGKGGKIIEKLRNDTGAQIRILPKGELPGCALPTDELVQISGDTARVKKAMYEISARIHENPPRDRPQGAAPFLPSGSMHPSGGPFLVSSSNSLPPSNLPPSNLPPSNFMPGSANWGGSFYGPTATPFSGFGGLGSADTGSSWPLSSPAIPVNTGSSWPLSSPALPIPGSSWPLSSPALPVLPSLSLPHAERKDPPTEQEFVIQVLCPSDRIGIVIGKGGNMIRQLRESTRARVKVEDAVPESEERVIALSANELLDEPSPVIDAALQLQGKTYVPSAEKEGLITTRLLVPSKQIGCLLGKRGSVISEMRKMTTADIKVLQKVDLPKCAKETDELVQVIGDENIARQALIEVLTRLRNNVFRDQIESQGKSGGVPAPALSGVSMAPTNIYGGHDLGLSGRMYSVGGLGLQGGQFSTDYGGLQGGPFSTDYGGSQGGPFSTDYGGLQGGRFSTDYGGLQGGRFSTDYGSLQGTGSGLGSLSGFDGGLYTGHSTGGGFGISDSLPKSLSGTTAEVSIPSSAVGSVLGKGGNNITQIRKISGAKVKLRDSRRGANDRVVEISGTPEQTQAAQSLLQGFILSGQAPAFQSL